MDRMTCSITTRHTPSPLTVEAHHLVPVAWQLFWKPQTAPFPGVDADGRGTLWDDRTVPVCPTHHRNVHALIVQIMRAVKQDTIPTLPSKATRAHKAEYQIAQEGLQHLLDAGGSLVSLAAAGEWGEA